MKYILLFVGIFLLIVMGLGTYCGVGLNNLVDSIINGREQGFNKQYKNTKFCVSSVDGYSLLPRILHGKYLVLLQNNYEIRPTGGFMGSYALVEFNNGVLDDWIINDIYTPDGQIKGYVEPKASIQQAFKLGGWRLPNSNWNPSFPESANDVLWFFEKGGVENIDGLIAINFEFIRKWVGIVGSIKPLDYEETLNEDNFYYLTQSHSQDDFFPGSHSKRNYLSSVGDVLISKTVDASLLSKIRLIDLIYKQLNEKQILVWHKDSEIMSLIEENGWSGSLGDYEYDYFYLVESNLGSNKANYCVDRSIIQNITINNKVINNTKITYTNTKDECANTQVQRWMGEYINYQRVIIPSSSQIENVMVNGVTYTLNNDIDPDNPPDYRTDYSYSVKDYGKYKEMGFWVFVPVQQSIDIIINYSLANINSDDYSIYIKRQPGIYQIPYKLTVNGELIESTIIIKDRMFRVGI